MLVQLDGGEVGSKDFGSKCETVACNLFWCLHFQLRTNNATLTYFLKEILPYTNCPIKYRLQIWLLILGEFKRINLLPLETKFGDDS